MAVDRLMPGYLPPIRYGALVVAAVALGYPWMAGCEFRVYLGVERRFGAAVVPPRKNRPKHVDPHLEWDPWAREWV